MCSRLLSFVCGIYALRWLVNVVIKTPYPGRLSLSINGAVIPHLHPVLKVVSKRWWSANVDVHSLGGIVLLVCDKLNAILYLLHRLYQKVTYKKCSTSNTIHCFQRTDNKHNKLCAWRHNMSPAPVLPCGRSSPRAPPSRRNVAVLSHAEYVPMLTAAATLRVKAVLSKVALWPWPFDLESLELRPTYATYRRQTKASINAPAY